MPPNAPFLPLPNQQVLTSLHDMYGELILAIGVREYAVQVNGVTELRKNADSIATVDGLQWNPLMAMRPNDPIFLAVCEFCRHPEVRFLRREAPTSGLVTLQNAVQCVGGCGMITCPRHRRVGSDRKPRCLRCARRHSIWRFFKPLFFKRVEE